MSKARTAKIISFTCQHCNEENQLNLSTGNVEAIYRRSTQTPPENIDQPDADNDPGSDVSRENQGASGDSESQGSGSTEKREKTTFGNQLRNWLDEGEDLYSEAEDQNGSEEG